MGWAFIGLARPFLGLYGPDQGPSVKLMILLWGFNC